MKQPKKMPYREALQSLNQAMGESQGFAAEMLLQGRGLSQSDFSLCLSAAQGLGARNFRDFIVHGSQFSAARQLEKVVREKRDGRVLLALLKRFYPSLEKLFSSNALRGAGYSLHLGSFGDHPFENAIEIRHGKVPVAKFSFDLFLNRGRKPSAMAGNMQGFRLDAVNQFKRDMGMPPLDFFLQSLKRGFPEKDQLVALNPRQHQYHGRVNPIIVAAQLERRGEITRGELYAFAAFFSGERATPESMRAKERVERRVKEIETTATGMHKAAFKKAGFKRSRGRTWRMRPKTLKY